MYINWWNALKSLALGGGGGSPEKSFMWGWLLAMEPLDENQLFDENWTLWDIRTYVNQFTERAFVDPPLHKNTQIFQVAYVHTYSNLHNSFTQTTKLTYCVLEGGESDILLNFICWTEKNNWQKNLLNKLNATQYNIITVNMRDSKDRNNYRN